MRTPRPPRILLAPDGFKGSLSASAAAAALARGVRRVWEDAVLHACPLSDGGEGFADVLATALGGVEHRVRVAGPLGDPVTAALRLLPDGTALVESAHAVGLALVPPERRAALETTTRGVGELLRAAVAAGARRILVGLGGTATTDGGAGMALALGAHFDGAPDDLRGGALLTVTGLRPAPPLGVPIAALTDVDAPLTGPSGAARRYAPQKGATADQVVALERALTHLAQVVGDPGTTPGDGAAGGLGYGLRVFAGATRQRGVDFVLDTLDFEARLDGVDLVLTGEGRLDAQSAQGKVLSGVVERCRRRGVPVIAVVGSVEAGALSAFGDALVGAYPLVQDGVSVEDAVARAASLLEERAATAIRAFW